MSQTEKKASTPSAGSRLKRKTAADKAADAATEEAKVADAAQDAEVTSSYFTSDKSNIDFIPSGSTTLDEVLGGGWAVGRIANVVGDRSAGKTLVATEAAANFHELWPDEPIYYLEAEAAFDAEYAAAMGMPVEAVTFVEMFDDEGNADNTVEFLFEHLQELIKARTSGAAKFNKCLYVVDSLDALSDRAEKERDNNQGSYGMGKQKKMSEMFRRIVAELEKAGITLLVISQIREKIGVTFGEKYTRSGGKALDFYCSQIVWLAEIGKIKRTVRRQERVAGVKVKAKCKKNKVALPFRECEYSIEFGYGIDNTTSCLEFLKSIDALGELKTIEVKKTAIANAVKKIKRMDDEEHFKVMDEVTALVKKSWREIDDSFLPERSKYGRKRLK
ncbi:MAG: hypothetical protein GY833_22130 [Aestuariibacter sp.]|nr:hypothetical protein [Aestuariibacter sp.]|tara:strand:- start:37936 stop:39102 length:1167 start_codon:yes stop_codon:yes gene_type:complete